MSDEELKEFHRRLTQAKADRIADIAERRKDRHENIDFDNPNFTRQLTDVEQEMKIRGLLK